MAQLYIYNSTVYVPSVQVWLPLDAGISVTALF